MAKIGFLFPGQGAQFVGMGQKIAQQFKSAGEVFARADQALSERLSELCWQGPEDTLRLTANAQPAILTVSIACLRALEEYRVRPSMVAGLSLGEYSAYVAAGSIEFEDAVKLVRERGRIMQEAVPDGVGAMAAVLGLRTELVEQACREAGSYGVVEAANYNCPGQIVISGDRRAVEEASRRAMELGAKKVIPLNVSAPFHCRLMTPAAEKFARLLACVPIRPSTVPVIANVTAEVAGGPEEIRNLLKQQMARPVLWEQSVRRMLDHGIDLFIEVGPGKTLTGFVKKISPDTPCFCFDSRESLEAILESVGMGC